MFFVGCQFQEESGLLFSYSTLLTGHRDAWFGELDLVVCPLIAGDAQPTVGVLWEKCHMESLDDEYGEENDDEEGPAHESTAVEEKKHIPKNWSLFGSHFSQGFATAVTFSYVYHYKLSVDTNSACSSLLPVVQISPRGYQVYLYDCLQDVMFANNFFLDQGVTDLPMGYFASPSVFPSQIGLECCKLCD